MASPLKKALDRTAFYPLKTLVSHLRRGLTSVANGFGRLRKKRLGRPHFLLKSVLGSAVNTEAFSWHCGVFNGLSPDQ